MTSKFPTPQAAAEQGANAVSPGADGTDSPTSQGWSLGQKIVAAYGVAFFITISGSVLGFAASNQNQQKAIEIQAEAIEDVTKIGQLKASFIELLIHQRPLLDALQTADDTITPELQDEYEHFVEDVAEFQTHWQDFLNNEEFEEFEGEDGTDPAVTEQEAAFAARIQARAPDVSDYLRQVEQLAQQVDPSTLTVDQLPQIKAVIADLNQGPFILKLDDLLDDIVGLSKATEEEKEAATALLQQANVSQTQLTIGSILLAGVIGLLLVRSLSQIILRPLKDITEVTQQSIQTANFDLQVPVQSNDEVGILAQTFNAYSRLLNQLLTDSQAANQALQDAMDELQATQAQMFQQEKMSSLGQMVAGVAHEINNPVGFIHGNLIHVQGYTSDLLTLMQLYQIHYPDPVADIRAEMQAVDLDFIQRDLPKALSSMQVGTQRIREIVQSLRNFARADEVELRPADLHEGLENTLMILNHRLKAGPHRPEIEIVKDYATLPCVECYIGLLNQVFMNILANAIDAIEEDIAAPTATPADQSNSPKITIRTALVNHDWVEVAIANTGPPIPPKVQQHIFDPFFTTKPVGKGTGIGMSISYQIVTDKHHGKLDCHSEPDRGTEFTIQIPARQPQFPAAPDSDASESPILDVTLSEEPANV